MKQIKTIRHNSIEVFQLLHASRKLAANHERPMRAIRELIGKVLRLFWWPALVGTVLVIGSGALAYRSLWQAAPTSLEGTSSSLDRWNRGFYLAASVKNAAVLVRASRADNMQLLLVDFETGKRIRLKSERSHLLSPYLSPDGARLLFSRQPFDHQGHELVSCETATLTCRIILRSTGSIQSAIEISGDRILYVSSQFVKGFDGRIRLSHNDIWMFDPATGSRQLTDFRLYELHSLSASNSQIYFSATGPSRDRPVIPKYEPDANQQSNIFRLPFDPEKGAIDIPAETMTPLFASAGIATQSRVSGDGSLIAFLRTRTGINPYHYDLVIADQNSHGERLIESSGMGFSRPVVIDHDVYASITKEDRVLIRVDRPGEPSMKLIADIDDASTASADTVELKIEP
jgi:Tol biopolymer transport system component